MNLKWYVVVQIREGNPVLSSDWLTNDDLVDVIEFIPILISAVKNENGKTHIKKAIVVNIF